MKENEMNTDRRFGMLISERQYSKIKKLAHANEMTMTAYMLSLIGEVPDAPAGRPRKSETASDTRVGE
jgi:hypothetical protein